MHAYVLALALCSQAKLPQEVTLVELCVPDLL